MSYALSFRDLSLGYDRVPAVYRLDGEIAEGALTAIVGPNGAGKSTLLKGVIGAIRPLEGGFHSGRSRDTTSAISRSSRTSTGRFRCRSWISLQWGSGAKSAPSATSDPPIVRA